MHARSILRLFRVFFTVLLAITAMTSLSAGTAQAAEVGCRVLPPDTHIIAGPEVSTQFQFRCDNSRIRYVKVTLNIKRHRGQLRPDATVKSYQFDNFRDPSQAGVNARMNVGHRCAKGKKYHGDITVNVTLNADQMKTIRMRGKSVTCQ